MNLEFRIKNTLRILLITATIVLPMTTNAASNLNLTPLKGSFKKGQVFYVNVSILPNDKTIYTSQMEITYPSDKLSVTNFSFSDSLIPLKQPGYDLLDNVNGRLIKTAGIPGGASTATNFGTITFYAKQTGEAKISIGPNTKLLDMENNNSLSSSFVTPVYTITTPPKPKPAPKTQKAQVSEPKKEKVAEEPKEEEVIETKEDLIIEPETPSEAEQIVNRIMPYIYLTLLSIVSFVLKIKFLLYFIISVIIWQGFKIIYNKLSKFYIERKRR